MPNRIVVITGSRSIKDRQKVFDSLDKLDYDHEVGYVIEGEAEGVDRLAAEWCGINVVKCIKMPIPDEYHNKYGKGAGNIRNQDMLTTALQMSQTLNLEIVGLAIWDGSSTGTQDMINRMRKAGIPVEVVLAGVPKTKRLL